MGADLCFVDLQQHLWPLPTRSQEQLFAHPVVRSKNVSRLAQKFCEGAEMFPDENGFKLVCLLKIYLFMRDQEGVCAHAGGGEKGRGRAKIPSRHHAQRRARCGARSHDPGIMT